MVIANNSLTATCDITALTPLLNKHDVATLILKCVEHGGNMGGRGEVTVGARWATILSVSKTATELAQPS